MNILLEIDSTWIYFGRSQNASISWFLFVWKKNLTLLPMWLPLFKNNAGIFSCLALRMEMLPPLPSGSVDGGVGVKKCVGE